MSKYTIRARCPGVCSTAHSRLLVHPLHQNGMAIAGMIMGILSILSVYPCCGLSFNILGLIFSKVALGQIKANPQQDGKGMAILLRGSFAPS